MKIPKNNFPIIVSVKGPTDSVMNISITGIDKEGYLNVDLGFPNKPDEPEDGELPEEERVAYMVTSFLIQTLGHLVLMDSPKETFQNGNRITGQGGDA